jgi:hypothetical protein
MPNQAVTGTPVLCFICQENPKKYKCPTCSIVYCSLDCYNLHKSQCIKIPPPPPGVAVSSYQSSTTVLSTGLPFLPSSSSLDPHCSSSSNTTINNFSSGGSFSAISSSSSSSAIDKGGNIKEEDIEEENNHKVPLERLQQLWSNPSLRSSLKDPRLQHILTSILSPSLPLEQRPVILQEYLKKEGKGLQTFIDDVLITIGAGKREKIIMNGKEENGIFIFTGISPQQQHPIQSSSLSSTVIPDERIDNTPSLNPIRTGDTTSSISTTTLSSRLPDDTTIVQTIQKEFSFVR